MNSSRLFELFRSPFGLPGEWRQLKHAAVVDGDRVVCTGCGTSRQQHVQLHLQGCPVRGYYREGAEAPAATAVYAAWQRTVRAMHAFPKAAEAEMLEAEPAAVPVPLALMPFRSHVVAKVADVEF